MNHLNHGFKSVFGIAAVVVLLVPTLPLTAQATGTITGVVTASGSGGPLAGAQVSVQGTVRRTVTDAQGRYRLSIEPGTYTVQATTLGRQTDRRQTSVTVGGTSIVNFSLSTSAIAIEGVTNTVTAVEPVPTVAPCPATPADTSAASYCALLNQIQQQQRTIDSQQQAITDLQRRMDLLEQKK